MTTTMTLATPAVDPVIERAAFFFDLEMAELRSTIPQADAKPFASAKY